MKVWLGVLYNKLFFMPVLRLYKSIGRTPLEVINEYKDKNKTTIEKISYAGRLDPMAEGQLLVLTVYFLTNKALVSTPDRLPFKTSH